MRKKALYVVLGCLLAFGFIVVAPWKDWATQTIRNSLVSRGLQDVQLTVEALGFNGITFTSVSLPKKTDVVIERTTIGYSLVDFVLGQLHQLELRDVVIRQQERIITLGQGTIVFQSTDLKDTIAGNWYAKDMEVQPLPFPVPAVSGDGAFAVDINKFTIKGNLKSLDSRYNTAFSVDYYIKPNAGISIMSIPSLELPWNDGKIFIHDGWLQFSGKKRFRGNIDVKDVQLDTLLKSLVGEKASGSGLVSGRIPIIIEDDGTPLVHNAMLSAGGEGRIQVAEDALPDGNDQIAVLKGVLSNFHYDTLSIALGTDEHKKLSARMIVEGQNPQMYNGKPVKLNVQLTGDVLSLLQQSVPAFSDPKQLLKQGEQ
ncbi:MAG: YdbH domain-containing protein [Alphaproteobacteria bacterium]